MRKLIVMGRNRAKSVEEAIDVEGNLALASIYFYLGYYAGMRYSVNQMNSNAREEPESMRAMIELLPNEVSALRLRAEAEPATLKIKQLLTHRKLRVPR